MSARWSASYATGTALLVLAVAAGACRAGGEVSSDAAAAGDTGLGDAGAPDALAAGPDAGGAAPDDAATAPDDAAVSWPEGAFRVPPLLGRPAATSIAVNVVPAHELEVMVEAGPPGALLPVVAPRSLAADEPAVLVLEGLPADAELEWRLGWRPVGAPTFRFEPAARFHTARSPGRPFTFTIQADPHMDENSVPDLYARTLANVRVDMPDFHVDLGDTFMCEKHDQPLVASMTPAPDEPTVVARYLFERANFGVISASVPLFLVNGNHDGELGYLWTGTGMDLAAWTTRARQRYFLPPYPDAFYAGDMRQTPGVGERGAFYAFTWGDALFVMLDPFWDTTMRAGRNGWAMTLGAAQYAWLAATLRGSGARWKFVFIHNLVGGLDGQQRGGVEAAPYFEWGGRELDGSEAFAQRRPASAGWEKPIHPLLVEAGVTAVFHGHDHLYAHQALDGVVYQTVPQPSARNTNNGDVLAAQYHYESGTALASAGHLRVHVAPDAVTSEYIRAWLPAQEGPSRRNAEVAHAWTATR